MTTAPADDRRELKRLQKRISTNQQDIDARNVILARLSEAGETHRALSLMLSEASGRPVVEDTVQKAIRKYRESNS